ncbi:MAG TPA: septal ring lytic transglycosylase RlpA family protein [Actinomycetota bacterium]|nr:septal ring lytic transglycosylase RlpA family protein [Actinomycetota bacterium]
MRLSLHARRVAVVLVGLAVLAGIPAAVAFNEPDTLAIDESPRRVPFRSTIAISGHMDGVPQGTLITLERERPNRGTWRPLVTVATDAKGDVAYTLERVRVTAEYRLSADGTEEGTTVTSEPVEIGVEPLIGLHARPDDVFAGQTVKINGYLFPKVRRDRRVHVQEYVDGAWRRVGAAMVHNGRFKVAYTPTYSSHRTLRVLYHGGHLNTAGDAARSLRVYESDLATWYGPGFYGNSTACGQRLDYGTLGVAHRTLPCGTKVSVYYRGRSITVTVIDRGPYTSANWDLTGETARRLGFSGKENVGVAY